MAETGEVPRTDDGMRACHDIAVFVEAGLVAAACGEQAQVWRLDPATGLPDTRDPLWVYDQDNVDFWHSATFSWDGKVVNFIDESFGDRCPTTTVKRVRQDREPQEYQTGNMFFMESLVPSQVVIAPSTKGPKAGASAFGSGQHAEGRPTAKKAKVDREIIDHLAPE